MRAAPRPVTQPASRLGSPSGGDPDALNAPLFHSLIERLENGGRCVVMDLGAARTETISLLGQFRCRLEIVDLAESLDELNAEEDPSRLRRRAEALLPAPRREPIDVVLCWDLLNYLQRPALAAVMDGVAARARPGTLAHALVILSTPRMPARPAGYVPLPDHRLAGHRTAGGERDAPRYTPEDLGRCLREFSVERVMLLRNGMQEYLFRT